MKLYTEEQVMLAYTIGNNDGLNGILKLYTKELLLTPIELPSNEEIEEGSINYIKGAYLDTFAKRSFFKAGAKWVIEQIKQQGK